MKKRIGLVLMVLLLIFGSLNFIKPVSADVKADVVYTVESSWDTGAVVKIVIKNK